MWTEKSVGEDPRLRWYEQKVDTIESQELIGTNGSVIPRINNSRSYKHRSEAEKVKYPYSKVQAHVIEFLRDIYENDDFERYVKECKQMGVPIQQSYTNNWGQKVTISVYDSKYEGIVVDEFYGPDCVQTMRLLFERYAGSLPTELFEENPELTVGEVSAFSIFRFTKGFSGWGDLSNAEATI